MAAPPVRRTGTGGIRETEFLYVRFLSAAFLSLMFLGLTACGQLNVTAPDVRTKDDIERERTGTLFGTDGISLTGGRLGAGSIGGFFGGGEDPNTFRVNRFLWQAAVETTAVLPIESANAATGAIRTLWYSPPGSGQEQTRLVVLVASGELRRNAVKVNAFRRGRGPQGQITEVPVDQGTIVALEEAIINRARQLRLEAGL